MTQQEFDERGIPVLQKKSTIAKKKNHNTAIKKNYHIHKIIHNAHMRMEEWNGAKRR
jgi:hypothetical protein